jgi:serpin B
MKPYLCWLLTGLLLLTGCVQPSNEEKAAARPTVTVTYYSEPTAVAPAAELPDVAGYDDFMSVLSAAVLDGTGNKNLSPVSVYIALSMAAEGARGETQGELLALLGAQDATDMRRTAQELLSSLEVRGETGEIALADSLWLGEQDSTVSFREAYLELLRTSYDAEARSVPFGDPAAGEEIAAWIREKTREKINISEDAMRFDADTLAVLINTVFLKDSWREPFNEDRTEQGIFFGLNGKEGTADYMRRTDLNGTIVRGEEFLRYALPLRDVGRMVFVLPDEGVSLESLLGSPESMEKLLHSGENKKADVDLMVPKFGFQDRTNLEEILQSLGVQTCFTGMADFSGMTDTPAHVSRVLQESYIGVDEKGVEAAAYTLVALAKSAAIPVEREKIDFHLTRPFLYAIESRDGTVLFLGTVAEPVQE